MSRVTQLAVKFAPSRWLPNLAGLQRTPGSPRLGSPRRPPTAPARWQPWSPPRSRLARAQRALPPRSRGSGRRPRGLLRGRRCRGYPGPGDRVQVTSGRGLLEAVQAPLPEINGVLFRALLARGPSELRDSPRGGGAFSPGNPGRAGAGRSGRPPSLS